MKKKLLLLSLFLIFCILEIAGLALAVEWGHSVYCYIQGDEKTCDARFCFSTKTKKTNYILAKPGSKTGKELWFCNDHPLRITGMGPKPRWNQPGAFPLSDLFFWMWGFSSIMLPFLAIKQWLTGETIFLIALCSMGLISCSNIDPKAHSSAQDSFFKNQFYEWNLGKQFIPDFKRVIKKGTNEYRLTEKVVIDNQWIDFVILKIKDDILQSIQIKIEANDSHGISALEQWANKVCESFKATRNRSITPSPLGTPEEGKIWNPVITTTTRYTGQSSSFQFELIHDVNSARDFKRLCVTINLTAKSSIVSFNLRKH